MDQQQNALYFQQQLDIANEKLDHSLKLIKSMKIENERLHDENYKLLRDTAKMKKRFKQVSICVTNLSKNADNLGIFVQQTYAEFSTITNGTGAASVELKPGGLGSSKPQSNASKVVDTVPKPANTRPRVEAPAHTKATGQGTSSQTPNGPTVPEQVVALQQLAKCSASNEPAKSVSATPKSHEPVQATPPAQSTSKQAITAPTEPETPLQPPSSQPELSQSVAGTSNDPANSVVASSEVLDARIDPATNVPKPAEVVDRPPLQRVEFSDTQMLQIQPKDAANVTVVLTDIKAKKAASVDTSGAKTNSDASISLASKAVIKVDQSVSYDAILIEDTTMPVVRLHRYSFGTVKDNLVAAKAIDLLKKPEETVTSSARSNKRKAEAAEPVYTPKGRRMTRSKAKAGNETSKVLPESPARNVSRDRDDETPKKRMTKVNKAPEKMLEKGDSNEKHVDREMVGARTSAYRLGSRKIANRRNSSRPTSL